MGEQVISRALDPASTREPVLRSTHSEIAFAAACDRAALIALLETYLRALACGDTQDVPFAANARATEDGIDTPIGAGLWQDAPKLGAFRHCTADVERGEIGCLTSLDLAGEPALLSLRLQIEARRIREVESWLTRSGQAALFAPQQLDPKTVSVEHPLPVVQRTSRTDLRAAVDHYFDAIERCDGSRVSLDPECRRFQNGVPTQVTPSMFAELAYIERVDRRYCAIDDERGLVWGIFAFQIPGDERRLSRTTYVSEAFHVAAGRIRVIHAFARSVPYGTPSGW